jgi:NADH-quinone oxidoreductase subunit N
VFQSVFAKKIDFEPKAFQEEFGSVINSLKDNLPFIAPELVLVGAICVLILAGLFVPRRDQKGSLGLFSLVALLGAGWLACSVGTSHFPGLEKPDTLFQGMIAFDSFAVFFKALFLLAGAVVVIQTYLSHEFEGFAMGEYYSLMLASLLGCCLLAAATDMVMIYLALELVSIPTYILVIYRKADKRATESALKYAIYGSVAGGVMIYGLSLFYGLTGSTALTSLSTISMEGANAAVVVIAGFLVFAGFAYKMAAVPMHFWCPDVYEGAPIPVTSYLSVASKAAGFAAFVRFMDAFGLGEQIRIAGGESISIQWVEVVAIIAAVTMTFGNLSALFQDNVKRMLGYSSIAHAGYLLMGVVGMKGIAGDVEGFQAISFYFLSYLFMNLGAFTVVIVIASRTGAENIESYKGLGPRMPFRAACLAIFLVGLIGLPPTGGFTGKFMLLKVVILQKYYWLAIVAGINTAISVYYYARIIKNMWLEKGSSTEQILASPLGVSVIGLQAAMVLVLGVFFSPFVDIIQRISFLS